MADEPDTKPDEPVEATEAPETPEAEATAEAPAAEEKPKPKRAPRKKATPKAEAEAEATAEGEAETAETAEKPKPRTRGSRGGGRSRTAKEPVAEAPAKPEKPAARSRRGSARPEGTAPVVRAQARYVRTSARKARLVCDHIRGKSVDEARAILAYTPRAVARDWSKLLESAVANAEHNHELVGDELKVLAAFADEGPTLKRFQPRAMGRATRIRKRTSHLTIQLTPKD